MNIIDEAHEIWSLAQTGPNEGIENAADRISVKLEEILQYQKTRLLKFAEWNRVSADWELGQCWLSGKKAWVKSIEEVFQHWEETVEKLDHERK